MVGYARVVLSSVHLIRVAVDPYNFGFGPGLCGLCASYWAMRVSNSDFEIDRIFLTAVANRLNSEGVPSPGSWDFFTLLLRPLVQSAHDNWTSSRRDYHKRDGNALRQSILSDCNERFGHRGSGQDEMARR